MNLYRHFDEAGTLLYVGVSFSAIARLAQHRAASHWYAEIAKVTVEKFETRELALEAEIKAISEEQPIHNLMRPRVKVVRAQVAAEESRKDLLKRLVQFNPMYSVLEAAKALDVSADKVRSLIHEKKLGHVFIGDSKKRYAVTGWQLIEFIEHLQSEASS